MFGLSNSPIDIDSLPPLDNDPVWMCLKTGIQVPTGLRENLTWRNAMLTMAAEDAKMRADLYAACETSLLFFVMAFGYTLRVHEPGPDGKVRQALNPHLPFILWPWQQENLRRMERCVDEGESAVIIKSRDMGLSWMTCVLAAHRLLFRPDNSLLFLSRKEQVLDLLGGLPVKYPYGPIADPSTLLGKIDYFLSRLPKWIVGKRPGPGSVCTLQIMPSGVEWMPRVPMPQQDRGIAELLYSLTRPQRSTDSTPSESAPKT